MLKKLRRRFILITMGLVAIVLIAVLATGIITTYQVQYNRIQSALADALGPDGSGNLFGVGPRPLGPESSDADAASSGGPPLGASGSGSSGSPRDGRPPNIARNDYGDIPIYVVTRIEATGEIISTGNQISMDDDLVISALEQIKTVAPENTSSPPVHTSGRLSDLGLFYHTTSEYTASGLETHVSFASSRPLITLTLRQMVISLVILVAALLVLFCISLFLSKMALRPVKEAWDKQRRFVADASHELKTPLTVILANNNVLQSHPSSTIEEQMHWLDSTQIEAQRMDALVRDLLLLAQTDEQLDAGIARSTIESTKAPFEKTRIDLSALVERSLLQFEAVFFERETLIDSAIKDTILVDGNPEQLDRLLSILLDNASKYSDPKGTIEISLENVAGTKGSSKAKLAITNGGTPIDPERIPYLFERFYRVDDAHNEQISGYGLGLSLAHSIVELHGGTIEVASSAEKGTTFTIFLPTKP